jgi:hypothetical protein
MNDYIFLMHDDAQSPVGDWALYLETLRRSGRFEGGSAIGAGACVRKSGEAGAPARHLTGFLRIQAASLDDAKTLLAGNPVFEAGGTVEIRALPRG